MILYSIYPVELIMGEEDEKEESYREVEFEGRKIVVEVNSRGEQRISRLISTDPNDFLDPRWSPGNIIF
jgi:CelD/BcsL family acetyltransferase involved in cellulose biosynthesis